MLAIALGVALLLRPTWTPGFGPLELRTTIIALMGLLVFSVFERWPSRLPRWIARWPLQVVAVGVTMPLTTLAIYLVTNKAGLLRSGRTRSGWTAG